MTTDTDDQHAVQARDNYQEVLVPTDGSDAAQRAAERGIEIAAALEAAVHAFSVIEGAAALKRDQLRVDAEGKAKDAVDRVAAEADRTGVDVTSTVRSGVPHEAILEYVEEADIDMIVMGTHGRTGLDHVIIGSIAERIVRNASIPVLTVRPED